MTHFPVRIKLPVKTVNEANGHKKAVKKNGITKYKTEHWTETAKRHRMQKDAIYYSLKNLVDGTMLPCTIKLTRIAPRKLDKWDNLPMSFKWILDSITALMIPNKAIGQTDSDPRIQVEYDQIKGGVGEYAIEIEIYKKD